MGMGISQKMGMGMGGNGNVESHSRTSLIGIRTTVITQDTRETVFLFQRLSIALQQGNAVSFLSTMNTE